MTVPRKFRRPTAVLIAGTSIVLLLAPAAYAKPGRGHGNTAPSTTTAAPTTTTIAPTTTTTIAPTTTTTVAPTTTTTAPPTTTTTAPGSGLTSTSPQPPIAITGGSNWPLAFEDNFDGTMVDTTKWNVANNSNYGSSNNEIQCYMARNASVANGTLSLLGRPDTNVGCAGYGYSSAYLTTRGFQGNAQKQSWIHGYIEVRMKAPEGNIFWPAFWAQGGAGSSAWPGYGELDAVELYPACPNAAFNTLHYDGSGHVQTSPNMVNVADGSVNVSKGGCLSASSTNFAGAITSAFHTYGVAWTTNKIIWTVDGKVTYTFDGTNNTLNWNEGGVAKSKSFPAPTTDFWNQPHTITLNLAMGGDGPGYLGWSSTNTIGSTTGSMQVDYVRQWNMP